MTSVIKFYGDIYLIIGYKLKKEIFMKKLSMLLLVLVIAVVGCSKGNEQKSEEKSNGWREKVKFLSKRDLCLSEVSF